MPVRGPGSGSPLASEAGQEQGEVASSELAGPPLVAKAERRNLFEDERQVVDLDVGAKPALGLRPPEEPGVEVLGTNRIRHQVVRRRERPGQVDRDGEDVGIEDSLHEGRERRPCVALVRDRNLGFVEVPVEAVACQLAEQVLLARVAAIERPDPDAGSRGHCRYGRVGVLEEDLARRLEDARVVAARLSLAPAQLALDLVLHLDSIA